MSQPVTVDEFRIGTAETYDVIVRPDADRAFTIFAQAEDRSGFARGTLAPRAGMTAIPPLDPRPLRTMADMGMGGMEHGRHGRDGRAWTHSARCPGWITARCRAWAARARGMAMATTAGTLKESVEVDNVAMMPSDRQSEAGRPVFDGNGRQVLRYTDLRALKRGDDPRPPSREIVLHLTGNMERFIWGFDGKKFSEAGAHSCSRAASACASC